ncbi:MAG: SLBB domain-containing protein, partial [Armatimonadetes bacterium]|nr:SLBB domain-containing protein [Armatimonadota bacterium]
GPYQLDQARSVLDAWSLVGKPLDDADLSHVVLLREGEKPRAIDIDALVNKGDMTQNAELKPGDKLVVPKAVEYVYVLGQVAKPGPKAYKPGETLIELIGRAGGPTPLADVKSIVLVHREQLVELAQESVAGGKKPARTGRRGSAQKAQPQAPTQPKEGQKVTIMDLAKVQGEKEQYIARAGDVIYIPAVREKGRNWLPSVLASIVTGLIVRR